MTAAVEGALASGSSPPSYTIQRGTTLDRVFAKTGACYNRLVTTLNKGAV
ncbi:hypothetical protein ACFX5Q_32180 [Mesorhizobium sp. IMUNJ 23033]